MGCVAKRRNFYCATGIERWRPATARLVHAVGIHLNTMKYFLSRRSSNSVKCAEKVNQECAGNNSVKYGNRKLTTLGLKVCVLPVFGVLNRTKSFRDNLQQFGGHGRSERRSWLLR